MTELMKRYESELANEGLGELKRISDIAIRILDKQVEILQAENAKLKAQLTWIPIADRLPSDTLKEQVFVKYKDHSVGFMDAQSVKIYRHTATHWLPIPPKGDNS